MDNGVQATNTRKNMSNFSYFLLAIVLGVLFLGIGLIAWRLIKRAIGIPKEIDKSDLD